MAEQKTRSRRESDGDMATHEQKVAEYLEERIKPGLNRGSIPLLARSIAKEIVRREHLDGGSGESEAADDEEAGEEPDDAGETPADVFEAEMHDLQKELGDDWIVRFSVHGDAAWLTAEKEDGSQHVEAETAALLTEAVGLLNEGGGRPG